MKKAVRGAALSRMRGSRLLRQDEGQAMMQMALALGLTIGTALLVLEFSMMAYTYAVLNDAAREGVRYAVVHGSNNSTCSGPGGKDSNGNSVTCGDSTGANVVTVVTGWAASSLHSLPSGDVTVTYATNSNPLSTVTVQIQYQYVPFIHFPGVAPTLTVQSSGIIVN